MRRAQTRPARERRRAGASPILRHLAHAVAARSRSQAADSSELEQLRLSGMLLARELREQECDIVAGEEARAALPPLQAALAESRTLNSTQESQLTDLRATLCASAAAAQQVDSIDKQLVLQLLVKYFEGSRKSEPLVVLASMLGCSEGQRRILGLPSRADAGTQLANQKLSDMWADWLMAEAEQLPSS